MSRHHRIAVYVETPNHARTRYTVSKSAHIWTNIKSYLESIEAFEGSATRYAFDLEVVGVASYTGIVVDFAQRMPAISYAVLGVDYGWLIRIENFVKSEDKPVWPKKKVATIHKPLVLEFRDLDLKAVGRDGMYRCDFEGCTYSNLNWKDGVVKHFRVVHGSGSGYCCPHPNCRAYHKNVTEYVEHTKEEHNGIRIPRHELPVEEINRRKFLRFGHVSQTPGTTAEQQKFLKRKRRESIGNASGDAPGALFFKDGLYECDFKDCDFKCKSYTGGMRRHFRREHDTGDGYCCSHPGCKVFCPTVEEYQTHLKEAHDGVVLPRVFVDPEEVRERKAIKHEPKQVEIPSPKKLKTKPKEDVKVKYALPAALQVPESAADIYKKFQQMYQTVQTMTPEEEVELTILRPLFEEIPNTWQSQHIKTAEEVVITQLPSPDTRVKLQGSDEMFLCDFKDCLYKCKVWLGGMTRHFTEYHESGRGFCCPYDGCSGFFKMVNEYEDHIKDAHNGIKIPRVPIDPEEVERRKEIYSETHKSWKSATREFPETPMSLKAKKLLKGSDIKVQYEGYFYCDFEGCGYRTRTWKEGMLLHYRDIHASGGGYCCPHEGCDAYYMRVKHYETHLRNEHGGIRVARKNLSPEETQRRRDLYFEDVHSRLKPSHHAVARVASPPTLDPESFLPQKPMPKPSRDLLTCPACDILTVQTNSRLKYLGHEEDLIRHIKSRHLGLTESAVMKIMELAKKEAAKS